jgi:AcrR family transcriptional regulator
MRRVAEEFGTGPAWLYWHVANKDELVDRVLKWCANGWLRLGRSRRRAGLSSGGVGPQPAVLLGLALLA